MISLTLRKIAYFWIGHYLFSSLEGLILSIVMISPSGDPLITGDVDGFLFKSMTILSLSGWFQTLIRLIMSLSTSTYDGVDFFHFPAKSIISLGGLFRKEMGLSGFLKAKWL